MCFFEIYILNKIILSAQNLNTIAHSDYIVYVEQLFMNGKYDNFFSLKQANI